MPRKEISEEELIGRAINSARKAYNTVFEEEGIDPAYFPLVKLHVHRLSCNFDEVLGSMISLDSSATGKESHEHTTW